MQILIFEELEQNWMELERPSKGPNEYMFIELPQESMPKTAAMVFYNVQLVGYIPIIARAEKNLEIKENPLLLNSYIERGVFVHTDTASLLGFNGKSKRKTAFKICAKGLVHFVLPTCDQKEKRRSECELAMRQLEARFPSEQIWKWKQNAAYLDEGIANRTETSKLHAFG